MTKMAVTPFDPPYPKNPRLHGSVLYRIRVIAEVLHFWNIHFRPFFCSCDLDLDSTLNFIYKLDTYSLEIYRMCRYFIRQGFRKLSTDRQIGRQTDRQTRPKLYTTQLRGWSKTCRGIEPLVLPFPGLRYRRCVQELSTVSVFMNKSLHKSNSK